MFLVIYRKGKKYYWNVSKKITDRFTVTNEKFETVKLGYNQKVASYAFNGWGDYIKIKDELKKYGLRLYVAEVRFSNKTQIKFVMELMNNPLYNLVLNEAECENSDIADGDSGVRVVELWNRSDWIYAQEQFNFESDFWKNLF